MQGRDLRSIYRWEYRRAHRVNAKLQQQLQAESELCPFTPNLSNSSRKIATGYSMQAGVHERLWQDGNRRHENHLQDREMLKQITPKAFAEAGRQQAKMVESAKSLGASLRSPKSARSA